MSERVLSTHILDQSCGTRINDDKIDKTTSTLNLFQAASCGIVM